MGKSKKKVQKQKAPMMQMPFRMPFLPMMPKSFVLPIPFIIPIPLVLPIPFMSGMLKNNFGMGNYSKIENYIKDKYYIKAVDKPIEKPNIIKLSKAKIIKTNKTPEEALDTVFSLLIPNIDKNKSIFEQGIKNHDVLKIITRCGENGYKLEMKDIFAGPTFNQMVKKLKRG